MRDSFRLLNPFIYKSILLILTIILVIMGLPMSDIKVEIEPQTDTMQIKENGYKPVKISFATWGSPADREIQRLVAKVFTNQSGVEVDVFCFSDAESCTSKVITQFAAGDPFDVFYADERTSVILAQKGWLLELNDLEASRKIKSEEYYRSAYQKGVYQNDRLIGLPTGINPYVIYFNKKLFKDAGLSYPDSLLMEGKWNLETLMSCSKSIKGAKNVYGMTIKNDWQTFFSILYSNGGKAKDFLKEGRVLTDESALNSFVELRKGISSGSLIYMGALPKGITEEDMFKSEQVAMVYGGYEYASAFKDIRDFDWDIVPFPSVRKDCSVSALSIPVISCAKYSKQKDAAREFLLFYASSEGQKLRLEKGEKTLPTLKYTVYLSGEEIILPKHSNFYFYSLDEGFAENMSASYLENKGLILQQFGAICSGIAEPDKVINSR